LDVTALVLLLIGGIVLPVLGWIIGVILLWRSATWSSREKLLGTFVVPGGLLLPLFVDFWFVPGWGACDGEYETLPNGDIRVINEVCIYDGITGPEGHLLVATLALASIGVVIYLARRMRKADPAGTI
jgi:hypothetical protein